MVEECLLGIIYRAIVKLYFWLILRLSAHVRKTLPAYLPIVPGWLGAAGLRGYGLADWVGWLGWMG